MQLGKFYGFGISLGVPKDLGVKDLVPKVLFC